METYRGAVGILLLRVAWFAVAGVSSLVVASASAHGQVPRTYLLELRDGAQPPATQLSICRAELTQTLRQFELYRVVHAPEEQAKLLEVAPRYGVDYLLQVNVVAWSGPNILGTKMLPHYAFADLQVVEPDSRRVVVDEHARSVVGHIDIGSGLSKASAKVCREVAEQAVAELAKELGISYERSRLFGTP